jgi:hypothetical protein
MQVSKQQKAAQRLLKMVPKPERKRIGGVLQDYLRHGVKLVGQENNRALTRALGKGTTAGVKKALFRELARQNPYKAMEVEMQYYKAKGYKINENMRNIISLDTQKIYMAPKAAIASYKKASAKLKRMISPQVAKRDKRGTTYVAAIQITAGGAPAAKAVSVKPKIRLGAQARAQFIKRIEQIRNSKMSNEAKARKMFDAVRAFVKKNPSLVTGKFAKKIASNLKNMENGLKNVWKEYENFVNRNWNPNYVSTPDVKAGVAAVAELKRTIFGMIHDLSTARIALENFAAPKEPQKAPKKRSKKDQEFHDAIGRLGGPKYKGGPTSMENLDIAMKHLGRFTSKSVSKRLNVPLKKLGDLFVKFEKTKANTKLIGTIMVGLALVVSGLWIGAVSGIGVGGAAGLGAGDSLVMSQTVKMMMKGEWLTGGEAAFALALGAALGGLGHIGHARHAARAGKAAETTAETTATTAKAAATATKTSEFTLAGATSAVKGGVVFLKGIRVTAKGLEVGKPVYKAEKEREMSFLPALTPEEKYLSEADYYKIIDEE